MDDRERAIRQKLKDDFAHFASRTLHIRTKSGAIEKLKLNKAQLHIHELVERQREKTGKVRAIILKGRQQGCSTYTEARLYWRVIHSFGVRAFILTHEEEATRNLFEMAKRFHERCNPLIQPHTAASNAKELVFDKLDSGYKLGTAGNKSTGRSSTIQFFHGSEVAFWPHASEHAMGVLQTIPNEPNTEVFLESTANGVGNYFYQQWQLAEAGESDFIPIFIPWFWQEEYQREVPEGTTFTDEEVELGRLYKLKPEQLYWRRKKISELSASGIDGSKAFKQEYPCNAIEAFQTTGEDSFIPTDLVMQARHTEAEGFGPLVIGVDPARFGDDRTSIVFRQGRNVPYIKSYSKKDTMEVAGIVHTLIHKHQPTKVYIDVGGLGAGVVDRLRELGLSDVIVAVNAGSKARDEERYLNKRAEMWGEMKLWLQDQPVSVPDVDDLHADLCGVKYSFDSKARLKLESKKDMKRRGLRSPDVGDALALTFAMPTTAMMAKEKDDKVIARTIMRKDLRVKAMKRNRRHGISAKG